MRARNFRYACSSWLAVLAILAAACNAQRADGAAPTPPPEGGPPVDSGSLDSGLLHNCTKPLPDGVPRTLDSVASLCAQRAYVNMVEFSCEQFTVIELGADDCADYWVFDSQSGLLQATATECNNAKAACTGSSPGFTLTGDCFDPKFYTAGNSICPDAGSSDGGAD